MKTEVSAGGVVIRKSRNKWQVLLIRDRNDSWTFPKGKIEKDETRKQAAVREIAEEVGLTALRYLASAKVIHYFYKRGSLVDKTVYYYVFEALKHEWLVNQKEEGIHNATWVSFAEAYKCLGYPGSNTPVLKNAEKLLGSV